MRKRTDRGHPLFSFREHVQAGGLISYGQHLADSYRRAATYVDRIFKGAKPGELPVELSTRLELIVNLKTAKALGLTVPDTVLARADTVRPRALEIGRAHV